MDDLSELLPQALAAPSAVFDPRDIMSAEMQRFTLDLASDLFPLGEVLERHGVTREQMAALAVNPVWKRMYRERKAEFSSIHNTGDRIKIKAALLAEMHLDTLHELISDGDVAPAARVSAYKAITAMTGLEKPEPAPPGARFELRIVLPGQQPVQVIDGEVGEAEYEEADAA